MNIANWIALSIIKYAALFVGGWVAAFFVVGADSLGGSAGGEIFRDLTDFLVGMSLLQGLPSVLWIIIAHLISLKYERVSVGAALSWGLFLPPLAFLLMGGTGPFVLQLVIQGVFLLWVKDFDARRRY